MAFEKKGLLELRRMSVEQVCDYYRELRKYEYDQNIPLKHIELRNSIHQLLVQIIKIDRYLAKEKLHIINDMRIDSNRPIIYASTHIGGNDVQRVFEAIKNPAYLFLGDPKGIYKDLSGLLLFLNGVICLETNDKEDRKIAKARAIELLNNGGNLLIFPEGAWNITQNLPVMPLYRGTVEMAKETGADIVPIAIEQYGNEFYVNIGKNIEMSKTSELSVNELNELLTDCLATLKWDVWCTQGLHDRKDVANQTLDEFQQSIIDRCEYGFTVQDVYDTMFKDKNVTTPEEAFAFLKRLN